MSSVKDTVKQQYAKLVDQAAQQFAGFSMPREGWLKTMRKALGMSAPELARRAGVTKPAIYQAERKEHEGGVTIQHMEKLAQALGGRFVYAIVPEQGRVNDVLNAQARKKAQAIVNRASMHMALEKQALSKDQLEDEIEALARELLNKPPSDFWADE